MAGTGKDVSVEGKRLPDLGADAAIVQSSRAGQCQKQPSSCWRRLCVRGLGLLLDQEEPAFPVVVVAAPGAGWFVSRRGLAGLVEPLEVRHYPYTQSGCGARHGESRAGDLGQAGHGARRRP